ncbi:MAG: hypothetical protein GF370_00990 [Candidatus Nealsonbacteria bacterium]|nr:hypothetical protein [Candidatus Nealsonbacteria bacterium]
MKKLLVGLTTAALVASIAAPALAEDGAYQMNCGNGGMVCNVQMSRTNTGMNGIANAKGDDEAESDSNDGNSIGTGIALSWADSKTVINSNLKEGCCGDGLEAKTQDNYMNTAVVKNFQAVRANSGMNGIANAEGGCDADAHDNDDNVILTGQAQAMASAKTMANSNLQRGCCEDQYNYENSASVINAQMVRANTGANGIANAKSHGDDAETEDNNNNVILTGDAIADAAAFTIVNSNIERGLVR